MERDCAACCRNPVLGVSPDGRAERAAAEPRVSPPDAQGAARTLLALLSRLRVRLIRCCFRTAPNGTRVTWSEWHVTWSEWRVT